MAVGNHSNEDVTTPFGGRSGAKQRGAGDTWADATARGQGAGAGTARKDRSIDAADQANPSRATASIQQLRVTPGTLWDEIDSRGYTKANSRPTGGNGTYGVDRAISGGRNAYERTESEPNGRPGRE